MGLLVCILLGAFTGWIAAAIAEVDEGVLSRIGIGMVGGAIGSLMAMAFMDSASLQHITLLGSLMAVTAAMLFLALTGQVTDSSKSTKESVL